MTNTAAGPSSGIEITRTAGASASLKWITDPLDGTDLTAAAWEFHTWAVESNVLANVALRFQVYRYTNVEAGTAALDDNNGTELTATVADYARTTGVATITTMNDGDRLVFKILLDDAGTMAAGYTATVSYNGQYAKSEGDSYIICPDTIAVTAATPQATRNRVRRNLQDINKATPTSATDRLLDNTEIDQAITTALRHYSHDRPYVAIGTLSGDGTTYDFRLPRLWVRGFSQVQRIEHPTGNQPASILDTEEYELYDSVLGPQPTQKLRFSRTTPGSGTDNISFIYTAHHIHDDENDTVWPEDIEALCWLAAAFGADMLAAKMAASSDTTIAADSVNYRDGEARWHSVSKHYMDLYKNYMGQGKEAVSAGNAYSDWDASLSGGGDRLFHTRRRR